MLTDRWRVAKNTARLARRAIYVRQFAIVGPGRVVSAGAGMCCIDNIQESAGLQNRELCGLKCAARVTIPFGDMRSALAFLVLGALVPGPILPPAQALVPPPPQDSRFGIMTHFAQGWSPVWADVAAICSIPNVRDELYWDQIEVQPGVYAFPPAFDNYMFALRRDGISPLIELDFANRV